jgi:hypothetical protein
MSSGMTIYELMHRAFLFFQEVGECDEVSRENFRPESMLHRRAED